jgi:3-methyladenine DNA glycosylase AlkD
MPPAAVNPKALTAAIRQRVAALRPANTPTLRRLRRDFSKLLAGVEPRAVLGVAYGLLDGGDLVPRFVAYELVCHHGPSLAGLGEKELLRLGRGIDSWGAVDSFACNLSGRAWRERQIPDELIWQWARSSDRWWRRAALVSTVPLNNRAQGGHGDPRRTLPICVMLLPDRDDMVIKAMSWALRELAKRDALTVRVFLTEHQDALAPRVLREVGNKLSTGLKNPRPKKFSREL